MPADPCLPEGIPGLITQLAVLLVVVAGFCFMFAMREAAARLILAGAWLAISVATVPWHPGVARLELVQELVTWGAVLGICSAILGQPRIGAILAVPALCLFFVLPAIMPVLRGFPIWWLLLAIVLLTILLGLRKLLPVQERARVRMDSDTERVRDLLGRATPDQFRPPQPGDHSPPDRVERTARKRLEELWP